MVKKLISNKEILDELDIFFNELDSNRSNKTKYWLKDYIRFQREEIKMSKIKNKGYKKYNKGDVIKAHFGFRVGREFGGLHYAIVIGGYENRKSDTLTVIPLKSAKANINIDFLRKGEFFLGHDVYDAVSRNLKVHLQKINEIKALFTDKIRNLDIINDDVKELSNIAININCDENDKSDQNTQINNIIRARVLTIDISNKLNYEYLELLEKCKEIGILKSEVFFKDNPISEFRSEEILAHLKNIKKSLERELKYIDKLIKENDKMKESGSIALINQITTISKIRIYDPKTSTDALNNIKISKENLIKIEREIKKMLTFNVDK